MISKETRQRVLRLAAEGYGIRWIARHMKLSRNSVRKILALEAPVEAEQPKQARRSLLDPYKEKIEQILREEEIERKKFPRRKPLTTKNILKEIRKLGYQGGHTILDDHLRSLRGPSRRLRKPSVRFETAIAEEAQQDWSPYRVTIGCKVVTIQVFSLILCWSRYQFLRAHLDQKQSTLLCGHVAAFRYLRGVPWSIVYDQQKTIMPCQIDGKPIIHENFQQFADHYGFEITMCRAGHKERKGKVEKPFLLFETDFLPRRKFESLEDLNSQLERWLNGEDDPEEGNRRKHGTTGETPYDRWLREKEYLYKLPPTDLMPRRVEERTVNHDCTVSVGSCLYTVPARLVERGVRRVWVSIGPEDLLIYDKKGELVATHRIHKGPEKLVIDEAHYKEIRRRKRALSRPELERRFLKHFPRSAEFLESLKATLRSIAPIHLREILALARRYRHDEVEAALTQALSHGTATAGYVRQILGKKHPTAHIGDLDREPPRGLSLGPVEPGDVKGYEAIFEKENEERSKPR